MKLLAAITLALSTNSACAADKINRTTITAIGETPGEGLGLRRMSNEELVSLTEEGVLNTPVEL